MKMIAVILFSHFRQNLLTAFPLSPLHRLQFRTEVLLQFLPGDPAKGCIGLIQTDIIQLVQVAENTHLGELRHPCQEYKTQVTVAALQHPVEGFQRLTVLIKQRSILQSLQKRFIVFVHQNNHPTACLFTSATDYTGKAGGKRIFGRLTPIQAFPNGQPVIQQCP